MVEFKQENLSELLNNIRNIRNEIDEVLTSLPGYGRRSDIGYLIHDIYVEIYRVISELNHIIEFRIKTYDMFPILKNLQCVYNKICGHTLIFKESDVEEHRDVSKRFYEIGKGLKSHLDEFKEDELKLDEFKIKEFENDSKTSEKKQCKSQEQCSNFLEKHCEKYTHPKRLCPDRDNCDKTSEEHFKNCTH